VRHHFVARESESPQGGVQGVVADRSLGRAERREQVLPATGQRLEAGEALGPRAFVDPLRLHVQPLAGDRFERIRLGGAVGLSFGAGIYLGGDQLPRLVPPLAGLLQ